MTQKYFQVAKVPDSKGLAKYDAIVVYLKFSKSKEVEIPFFAQEFSEACERFEFKAHAKSQLVFDLSPKYRAVLAVAPKKAQAFDYLEQAREVIAALRACKAKKVLVDLRGLGQLEAIALEAVVSAAVVAQFSPRNYSKKKKPKVSDPELHFILGSTPSEMLASVIEAAEAKGRATNLVRSLALQAGNDLTATRYVSWTREWAKAEKLGWKFLSLTDLEKKGAGAFLAVSQGASDRGGGIVELTYEGSKSGPDIAIVGKGITFDTGGNQLKPAEYMLGMNGDMAGSAVAVALLQLSKALRFQGRVTAYLAITENALGSRSYRPNDVVTTWSGLSVEVIDTDAEGRMVLSDALHYAGLSKPSLIVDFATLTGSCMRAIGTNYSGVFSNRHRYANRLRKLGRMTGERVWPFPNDPDYARCLKSDIADIKQCRAKGGVDHIEAAMFLSRFIPKGVPWIHVDLSAIENDEGLAHVPPKHTGFGVRIGYAIMEAFLKGEL